MLLAILLVSNIWSVNNSQLILVNLRKEKLNKQAFIGSVAVSRACINTIFIW
jgi:hypothetical protein